MDVRYPIVGRVIGSVGIVIFFVATWWLVWSGNVSIRYTADHEGTIPIWNRWIPVLVGIILIRFLLFRLVMHQPLSTLHKQLLLIQTWALTIGALLFTTSLMLVDNKEEAEFQLWYVILKLVFLLVIPLAMFYISRFYHVEQSASIKSASSTRWHWFGPIIIFGVWFYINFFSVYAVPYVSNDRVDIAMLAIALIVGFFINSLLEEIFYRVWLQTRLEVLVGRWPAILFTSILWASWHMVIQSTGATSVDLASVIANQGVTGLFLGYLWSKYRNVWVLILIHGFINATPHLLMELVQM
ncbi:CPBP family intramembrane glutamic endopeptidase [Priestia taiwanensis]|uniref:CAAX prenyl protease 2/Lysostaphin resistance protein A-like domain-containing protein n=1 Tax=Priestia taiwanensis TaxID=1347902 RepID=A0A917AU54_9BACI|nr:CPBP family intramembrane glutamic endopeptidase [Priestia taiwanensis]MBM7363972.1 membrane protease YdiL (CAAX protease family) [Priestia taiwanensis]GGE70604.1 hypothetical protein GCM10007140_20630 [Priestia taiwanensis]